MSVSSRSEAHLDESRRHAGPATSLGPVVVADTEGTVGAREVVLLGNPNVGKTALFNALTGQNARVGNYPGVTVERRAAPLELDPSAPGKKGSLAELVDVPGAYSLSARSAEEQITMNAALGTGGHPVPDLVVVVVDANQVPRSSYLALQLAELEIPFLIALNMSDETHDAATVAETLSARFGVPCVATSARLDRGITELRRAIRDALAAPPRAQVTVQYPGPLLEELAPIEAALPKANRRGSRDRALALWALLSLEADDELEGIDPQLRAMVLALRASSARDLDLDVIGARWRWLDGLLQDRESTAPLHLAKRSAAERIDRVLLHPAWGFAIFVAVMLLVFQSLFSWADPAIGLIEAGVGALQVKLASVLPAGFVTDLVTQGIVGGVGNVIVFVPQIFLLFLFVGLLEDSGYMARVAYLMDRILRALGLHGRAFVPMMSGFACAVPAIMATRTLERQRDRLLTMMVIPLMTCSARLPVYGLVIAALFPPSAAFAGVPVQGLLLVGMYVFALAMTLAATAVLGRTVVRGRRVPLLLELPPYRRPNLRAVSRMVAERCIVFLREAGTVILVCTVILWGLLTFPRHAPTEPVAPPATAQHAPSPTTESARRAVALEASYGGRLGKAIEPALAPLGFDWKIGVGLLGAFAAREVFVSTMAVVYGVGDVDDEATPLRDRMRAETRPDGRPAYTPLVGLSLLVFFALACQCLSTLAVVRRETRSWRWPAFMFGYMTALAYCASLLVYQGGRLLGFG